MGQAPRTIRISARLDEALARKLEQLRRETGKSTTELLRSAIELYFRNTFQTEEKPARILERSGFVACSAGPADLSSQYKALLAASLTGKT